MLEINLQLDFVEFKLIYFKNGIKDSKVVPVLVTQIGILTVSIMTDISNKIMWLLSLNLSLSL